MKTFLEKIPAYFAPLFLLSLCAAFAVCASPDITPVPHWHIRVDTIAANVKWFGHDQLCAAAFLPFVFKSGPITYIASFLGSVLVALFLGAMLSHKAGIGVVSGFAISFTGLVLIGAASYLMPKAPGEYKRNEILKQIWIPKILEYFLPNGTFVTRSEDQSALVNFNTINLAEAGVDPDVLIDNTVYPIDVEERTDNPLDIVLRRMRTKNTVVRDAEGAQLAFNKLESVTRGHIRALNRTATQLAAFGWSPQADGQNTPVIKTTGTNPGSAVISTAAGNPALLAFTSGDWARCQKELDDLEAPQEGRIFVMCPQHRADIAAADPLLFKQLATLATGTPLNLYGFEVYWSQAAPKYSIVDGTKNAFNSAADANSRAGSFFYVASEMMRAIGDTEMFSRLKDPEADGDIIGFAQRFVALPYRNKYMGAIYSDNS